MGAKGGDSDNSRNGKGNNVISGIIPVESKKMVQSLKEIVNCSEAEIHATLKECNMDLDEAVNRLLSLDPFREVKSKKEKKKVNKDATDTRFRGGGNAYQRGNKGGGRGVSTQFSSYESAVLHDKSACRKENGVHAHAGSSFCASGIPGNSNVRRPPSYSGSVAIDNNAFTPNAVDGVPASSHPPGFQSSWLGSPGQASMADIVKMGRPQNNASTFPTHSQHDLHSSDSHWSNVPVNPEAEAGVTMPVDVNDGWTVEYPPVATSSFGLEVPVDSHLCAASRANNHLKSELDYVQSTEDVDAETHNRQPVVPASIRDRNMKEDGSRGSSLFNDNLYRNASPNDSHGHAFQNDEAKDGVSSVAANLEQLGLHDQEASHEEDNGGVIIPDHLQVYAQECSHLSFGSFGSGTNSFGSRTLKNNMEETSKPLDAFLTRHSQTRNNEYYGDEHLINAGEENVVQGAGVNDGTYDLPSVPETNAMKDEALGVPQGNQYTIPLAKPIYGYNNSQQLDNAYNSSQISTQMQNDPPLSSEMQQAYTTSLPSTLLSSSVPTVREPDLFNSPLSVTQALLTKYGIAAPSINGLSISISEALRLSSISNQPTPQTRSVAVGPALPEQLAVPPYSQPTLPFVNMTMYPLLHQNAHLPSSFQQTFTTNSTQQSFAAMLPQYKNSASLNSLQQSAAVASAYGFGTSNGMPPEDFCLNLPTDSVGANIGYDDVLGSQFKDCNHLISLQQSENPATWVNCPGSRTMSALPANLYYNLQSQHQQQGGYQQAQQPSQHIGANGYPNYYSQTGMLPELHQASTREGALSDSQGIPPNQSQRLWQNSY